MATTGKPLPEGLLDKTVCMATRLSLPNQHYHPLVEPIHMRKTYELLDPEPFKTLSANHASVSPPPAALWKYFKEYFDTGATLAHVYGIGQQKQQNCVQLKQAAGVLLKITSCVLLCVNCFVYLRIPYDR